MKILLTGASGQLGTAMQVALVGHDVIPLTKANLDVSDFDKVQKVVKELNPECILNTAAYTNVDGAETNVHLAYAVNALGPRNLAVVAASLDIPLMHVSTDYVFDGRSSVPYHEFDRPNPLSVYGASKLAGEEAIRELHGHHFIVRTAWLYHIVGRNFPKTITAMASRPVVRVVEDQVGSPTYAPTSRQLWPGYLKQGHMARITWLGEDKLHGLRSHVSCTDGLVLPLLWSQSKPQISHDPLRAQGFLLLQRYSPRTLSFHHGRLELQSMPPAYTNR